jgi:uncharacterized membrane protein YdjX (TVP38/TMEM64 family)
VVARILEDVVLARAKCCYASVSVIFAGLSIGMLLGYIAYVARMSAGVVDYVVEIGRQWFLCTAMLHMLVFLPFLPVTPFQSFQLRQWLSDQKL